MQHKSMPEQTQQQPYTVNNIPLHEFLDLALGIRESCTVSQHVCNAIIGADPNEQYTHIELIEGQFKLWRIAEWKVSNARAIKRKGLAEAERKINVHVSELRANFVKQLQRATCSSAEVCELLASVIISARDITSAKHFGIDIAELLDADTELQEFKAKNNIK